MVMISEFSFLDLIVMDCNCKSECIKSIKICLSTSTSSGCVRVYPLTPSFQNQTKQLSRPVLVIQRCRHRAKNAIPSGQRLRHYKEIRI